MQKNDVITVVAETLGTNGEGVARLNEYVIFIPYLMPGERATVRVLRVKDKIVYAKAEEIITPAEDRIRPRCPVFFPCGGCQLQHMAYRMQLKFKTGLVRDTLRKIGGIEYSVLPCERSDAEYGYRNKLQLPIGHKDGKNVIGFFAERSHRIVDTDVCPIHPDWAEKLIAALKKFMDKCGLDGYDEEKKSGQLRHIVVRQIGRKFLITLVVTVREIKGIDYLFFLLDEIFSEYSFYLNFNDRDTNVVFGEEFTLLKGVGKYERTENGISYEAGVSTFLQVNEGVRGKLYARAAALIGKGETVYDCYSGGGMMTAMFAKRCKHAYGIEIVPEASACANRLREKNGLQDKMTCICGKVEEVLPSLLKQGERTTVVLDPPRAGVDRNVLKKLTECGVDKILMISCNPATLARDLGILTGSLVETETGELVKAQSPEGDYRIEMIQPFDMFPQTKHVETLVTLFHKKPDSHIEVTVDFENGKIKKDDIIKRAESG